MRKVFIFEIRSRCLLLLLSQRMEFQIPNIIELLDRGDREPRTPFRGWKQGAEGLNTQRNTR